jgi:hypothetical protein
MAPLCLDSSHYKRCYTIQKVKGSNFETLSLYFKQCPNDVDYTNGAYKPVQILHFLLTIKVLPKRTELLTLLLMLTLFATLSSLFHPEGVGGY